MGQDAGPLTLEAALVEARAAVNAILAARADAARGRLDASSRIVRDNPTLDARTGSGPADGHRTTEIEFVQPLELGRGARVAAARAGVERTRAEADADVLQLEHDVATSFYLLLHADAHRLVVAAAETVAVAVTRIAERRHAAGDVPVLDVNLARTALFRARAESHAAAAASVAARGTLAALLGRDHEAALVVQGDLASRARFDRTADRWAAATAVVASPADRADLRALAAAAQEAAAEGRAAGASRWPRLSPGVEYRDEDGGDAVLGVVGLTLPLFDRGQEDRAGAAARARESQARLQLESRRAAAQVQTALAVYRQYAAAAEALSGEALPLLDRNESMSRRAYEAGQIPLGEWLWVRRELLDARLDHLNRLLDAARAGIDLVAAAGESQSHATNGGPR